MKELSEDTVVGLSLKSNNAIAASAAASSTNSYFLVSRVISYVVSAAKSVLLKRVLNSKICSLLQIALLKLKVVN